MMKSRNDDKKALITAASLKVFPRLGYHKTAVEDILKEAEVARSTFYVYFSNKREVFAALASGIIEQILTTVHTGVDSIIEDFKASADEGLDDEKAELSIVGLMTDVFRLIDRNKGVTRVFLHELVGIDREMTRMFHDFQEKVTAEFERLIEFGMSIGYIRDVKSHRSADFIVGGLIHLARNISSGVGKYDIEEISGDFVAMQLWGLRKAEVAVAGRPVTSR